MHDPERVESETFQQHDHEMPDLGKLTLGPSKYVRPDAKKLRVRADAKRKACAKELRPPKKSRTQSSPYAIAKPDSDSD